MTLSELVRLRMQNPEHPGVPLTLAQVIEASGSSPYDKGVATPVATKKRVATKPVGPNLASSIGLTRETLVTRCVDAMCDHAGTEIGKLSGVGSCPKCGKMVTAKEVRG